MLDTRKHLGWIAGLAYVAAYLALAYGPANGLRVRLEGALYGLIAPPAPGESVSLIAIDEASIKAIGPWPWSREIIAEAVDELAAAKARVVALIIPFAESQRGPRAEDVRELLASYFDAELSAEERQRLARELEALNRRLRTTDASAADVRLAASLTRAGNVVLPVLGDLTDEPAETVRLPDYISRQSIGGDPSAPLLRCDGPRAPIAGLAEPAARLGFEPVERRGYHEPLAVRCGVSTLPTLPLAIAAQALGLQPAQIRIGRGELWLGERRITTHADLSVLAPPRPRIKQFSFNALRSGSVPGEALAGATVLIGPTQSGELQAISRIAATARALEHGRLGIRPSWAGIAEWALIAAIGLFLVLIAHRLRPAAGVVLGVVFGPILLLALELALLAAGRWLLLAAPALLLASGQLVALVALSRPRRVQPGGAARRADPGFVADGQMPAGRAATGAGSDAPLRRLGRYEIVRDIGKGAMGIVYLGRDPNINRVVAIKAIPLAEEFEATDLPNVKARFFREAETAGRLNHPNIVTVFDAGEDGDVAFIAMEYLRGRHLSDFTSRDRLLPLAKTLELIARTADALNYAHKQGVIHRDIKPANLMYDPSSDELKITDFGIARLTDTSATRTGIVLGTPSFMSPEQLEGKNVSGHSDLFSLGVTLYQLLSGQLPFRADSMTGLMFKIANEPHRPVRELRPDLPECVDQILADALRKDPSDRYQTGAEMATSLRDCANRLSAS